MKKTHFSTVLQHLESMNTYRLGYLENCLTSGIVSIGLTNPFSWCVNELIDNFIGFCFGPFSQWLLSKFLSNGTRTGKFIIFIIHQSCRLAGLKVLD